MAAYLKGRPEFTDLQIRIFGRQNNGYPVELTLDRQVEFPRGYLDPGYPPKLKTSIEQNEIGASFFDWMFADEEIRTAWDKSVGRNPKRRVRLYIDDSAAELYGLPWEILTDGSTEAVSIQPIGADPDTPFSRFIPSTSRRQSNIPLLDLPVRMLIAISSPDNLEEFNRERLDVNFEENLIREAVADYSGNLLDITFLDQPVTLRALDSELKTGYQILHLLGHSVHRESTEESALFLSDDKNKVRVSKLKSIQSLLLRQKNQLNFIFFGGTSTTPFSFEAVRSGVPMALGTRDTVQISDYHQFAPSFYEHLFQHGIVDIACNAARSDLFFKESPYWANWVLVSNNFENQLFDTVLLKQFLKERKESVTTPIESVSAETSPEAARQWQVGTVGGAYNDEKYDEDRLGFNNYIEAFVDLIAAKETEPPLTIGIFGSWGMGKTFLLRNIDRRLQETASQRETHIYTINFNAWEYSANEVMWPGLVRRIMEVLEKEVSWSILDKPVYRRIRRNFGSQLQKNRVQIIVSIAVVVAIVVLALWYLKGNPALLWAVLSILGVSGVIGLIQRIQTAVSEPLSPWITALFEENNVYGKPLDHMVRIREDLKFLEEKLGDEARVLVLIDDLDRCEPEKAVEVLQAIKLLLNFRKFIVVLGVDARIVTRAIERHYEGLLGPTGASGYEYLDKIIQIPFRIPKPTPEEIQEFINLEMKEPLPPLIDEVVEDGKDQTSQNNREPLTPPKADDLHIEVQEEIEVQDEPKPSVTEENIEPNTFTYDELEIFQNLAYFIRPNPRHIKRILNVYRLVRSLARIKNQQFIIENPAATIRWLVMCAQWPYIINCMLQYYIDMLDKKYEGTLTEWPIKEPDSRNPDNDLLIYLFLQVNEGFDRDKLVRLDYDPDLLWQLLNIESGRLNWDELRVMRQYTINFNPAIESELLSMSDIDMKPRGE
jgi:Cdc6-like AAA superfamily ATPase